MPLEGALEDLSEYLNNKVPGHKGTFVDVVGDEIGDFRPRCKDNIGYIVAALVFNKYGEVLMIQEAHKGRSRGNWYMPAGKLEPEENLLEGAERVVKSETGLDFEPKRLMCVECCTGNWFRFTFGGEIAGGKLKTKDKYDKHSIQAKWWPTKFVLYQKNMQLRSVDILPLINLGVATMNETISPFDIMPTTNGFKELLYRLVLVHTEDVENVERFKVLVSKRGGRQHFPTAEINPSDSWALLAMYRILRDAFGREDVRTKTYGLLAVEHNGKPIYRNDGICLTILVCVQEWQPLEPSCPMYEWLPVTNTEIAEGLKDRILEDHKCTSLMDIF